MFEWQSWIGLPIAVVIALTIAMVVIAVVSLVARVAARRRDWPKALIAGSRVPFRLLLAIIATWAAVAATLPQPGWREFVNHAFLIATIASAAWFVGRLSSFGLGVAMSRYRIDVPDNRVARRVQTQLLVIRRLVLAVIAIVAAGAILLTFPGVQAVGASVLASAGIVSIVAGLAAQSTLANVFAGVQLAFSDAIRVDDVVIADGEWGRIEEITLTYVVVHIWDDRRMVLPSTYFTTTPFQNWTRRGSELLGAVEFDLDWRVSPSEMREELDNILARTPAWDGRTRVLQVTDATGGYVRVRILVTAVDAPTLFDLRCAVREQMVEWLHTKSPVSLPHERFEAVDGGGDVPRTRMVASSPEGLFTGSVAAQERATHFGAAATAPVPIVPGAVAPGSASPTIPPER